MTRKVKLKVEMKQCPLCLGFHAHWWYTSKVRPPSCEERIKRGQIGA